MTAKTSIESQDVYERSEGRTRLVSTTPDEVLPDPNYGERVPYAEFLGASPDGATVYFTTFQQLTVDDTEKLTSDIYAWHDGDRQAPDAHAGATQKAPGLFEGFSPMQLRRCQRRRLDLLRRASRRRRRTTPTPTRDLYRARADGTSERLGIGGAAADRRAAAGTR